MATVYAGAVLFKQLAKGRIFWKAYGVRGLVIRRLHFVQNGARPLRGQILPQRAAEGDVEKLQPAAYAESGLIVLQAAFQKILFHNVANGATFAADGQFLLFVQRGVYVLPARKEYAVAGGICAGESAVRRRYTAKLQGAAPASSSPCYIAR